MDNTNCKHYLMWLPALILGVLFVAGMGLFGWQFSDSRNATGLTVTGSVKERVSSDLAKWSASFSRKSDVGNLKDTVNLIESDKKKIQKVVTDLGLDSKGITFQPFRTEAIYEVVNGTYTQNIIGYTVHQDIDVESADIDKIESLTNQTKNIVDLGIVLDYQQTNFLYTKLGDLRPKLFAEATKDALARAQAIASGTGSTVGEIISARTGVIQILPPNSTDIADYGAYDLSTREKDISATVSVTFKLSK